MEQVELKQEPGILRIYLRDPSLSYRYYLGMYYKEKATGVRDILPVTTILKKVRWYSRLEYT